MEERTMGSAAYEAFTSDVEGTRAWRELPESVRARWEAAAEAVKREFLIGEFDDEDNRHG